MKNLKIQLVVCSALFIGVLTSCDNYLDVNQNPNNPTQVTPALILSNSELGFAYEMAGGDIHLITGALVQHYAGAGNQLAAYDIYDIQGDDLDNTWTFNAYSGFLNSTQDLINQAAKDPAAKHYQGIGKILLAYQFSVMTDAFGDIPFFHALNRDQFADPKFDKQEEIYPALIQMINEGLALLNQPSGAVSASADLIYGGNIDRWRRAANTLKMKLFLQARKVDAAWAKAGIEQVLAENNFINSNADDMELKFFRVATNQHPLFDFAVNKRPGDIAISQRFIDSLEAVNDPRINFYFEKQGQDDFIGYENGSNITPPPTSTRARLGRYPIDFDGSSASNGGAAPHRFLTNFMALYMRAEAALTLGTEANPRELFEQAMIASLNKVGVSEENRNAYVQDRLAAYDLAATQDAKLHIIMRDKWQAMLGNPFEAWNDYRRTGYPELAIAQNAVNINVIPTILPYGARELAANPNAPAQNPLNKKVWWDVD